MNNIIKKEKRIRALVIILGLLALGLVLYLIALPLYPSLKYKIKTSQDQNIDYKDINVIKKITEEIIGAPINIASSAILEDDKQNNTNNKNTATGTVDTPEANEENNNANTNVVAEKQEIKLPNTLIIPKIGVNIPIIESEDEEYGLDHGAWKLPKSSTPEEIGNMVLTGHRFKYLPPSNLTFYLFHKLEEGDIISVIWNNEIYFYRINEKKIVSADDLSILKQSKKSILTIYTCDPIYSTKNRLVIISELIDPVEK